MDRGDANFTTRLAETERDLRAAERLRYSVFVEELGGDGPLVDHEGRFERDRFDPHYQHLILVDDRRDADALDHVVGVYRLLDGAGAEGRRDNGRRMERLWACFRCWQRAASIGTARRGTSSGTQARTSRSSIARRR